ncbi:hypothetical protein BSKO_04643 [Bryopsis sp. KO-2023]|nr:hypothetical protein BSKO_04643 [Bryopsis sp. KO-2023]
MFGPSFKSSKCKTQCKLCVSRIKLLRSKRNIQLAQMRKEIGGLLRDGKDEYAWIRVEAVHREKLLLTGYEILELYLELLAVRAQLLEKAKTAPKDMIEALTSLMYAAPRVSDLPELFEVRKIVAIKFGRELGVEGQKGQEGVEPPTWQVNMNLRRCLAVDAPEPEDKLTLLSQIAEEQQVDFDIEGYSQTIYMSDPRAEKLMALSGGIGGGVKEPEPTIPSTPAPQPSAHPDGPPPSIRFAPAAAASPPSIPFAPVSAVPPQAPPPGWSKAFENAAPVAYPSDGGEPTLPYGDSHPTGSTVLPPSNPDFAVPHYGPSKGEYTDAQHAATAAMKAAEDARKAADAAQMFASQRLPDGSEPMDVDSTKSGSSFSKGPPPSMQEQYPPKGFTVKSPEELEQQYNAAPGAPEKGGPPTAPPAGPGDGGLPDVPTRAPPRGDVDDLPGIQGLPGSMDMPPPSNELEDLNQRFEDLKRRGN